MSRWGNDIMVGKEGAFVVQTRRKLEGLKLDGVFSESLLNKEINAKYRMSSRVQVISQTISFLTRKV